MYTIFWFENMKGRDHLEDLGVDEEMSEWFLGNLSGKLWTEIMRLRIGTSGGLL
jgi:hypothetical protein